MLAFNSRNFEQSRVFANIIEIDAYVNISEPALYIPEVTKSFVVTIRTVPYFVTKVIEWNYLIRQKTLITGRTVFVTCKTYKENLYTIVVGSLPKITQIYYAILNIISAYLRWENQEV